MSQALRARRSLSAFSGACERRQVCRHLWVEALQRLPVISLVRDMLPVEMNYFIITHIGPQRAHPGPNTPLAR